MQKPPHEITQEISLEDMARGQREQKFAEYMRAYRSGEMSDERWQDLLGDHDFAAWLLGL